jgi:hypothetical protein
MNDSSRRSTTTPPSGDWSASTRSRSGATARSSSPRTVTTVRWSERSTSNNGHHRPLVGALTSNSSPARGRARTDTAFIASHGSKAEVVVASVRSVPRGPPPTRRAACIPIASARPRNTTLWMSLSRSPHTTNPRRSQRTAVSEIRARRFSSRPAVGPLARYGGAWKGASPRGGRRRTSRPAADASRLILRTTRRKLLAGRGRKGGPRRRSCHQRSRSRRTG